MAVVNEVSRAVNPYFGRISDLKIKVSDLARSNRNKLTDAQTDQFVAEAARLQLLPDFVGERWIPAILAALPKPVEPPPGEPVSASAAADQPVTPEPAAPQLVSAESVPPTVLPTRVMPPPPMPGATADRDAITRKVYQFLDEYQADKHIPARVLRALFLATTFDENLLAETVLAYLSACFYAAETPVQGNTLKDKLLSTDWRHLSWWKPAPAPPVPPVAAPPATRPGSRGSSDTAVVGLSVLVVGLMIGGVCGLPEPNPLPGPPLLSQRNGP